METFIAAQGGAWQRLDDGTRGRLMFREGLRQLIDYGPITDLRAYAQSWAQLFLGGGAGNFHNLFGLEGRSVPDLIVHGDSAGYLDALRRSLSGASLAGLSVSALAIGFAVTKIGRAHV